MSPDLIELGDYGEFVWNITDATQLVAGREPELQDISRWITKLPGHNINEEHWPAADLSKPLIIAPLYGTGELWLIDGWHRVRLAKERGITVLPVHTLSQAEESKVRGYGGDKPA